MTESGRVVGATRPSAMISRAAGLYFRKEGGAGIPAGSSGIAAAIADCTSTAALSMSRSRSNCSVMLALPVELDEVIESSPAIVVNCRSSGLATADAIVAGSAPGRLALTLIVGKSTFGRSLTGRARYAMTPNTAIPSMIRLVEIGRRMKIADGLMSAHYPTHPRGAASEIDARGPARPWPASRATPGPAPAPRARGSGTSEPSPSRSSGTR